MSDDDRRLPPAIIVAAVILALAALAGPLVLIVQGGRSSAAFGDAETLGANHLGAGTLDIGVGAQSARLVADAMAPGDTALGWISLRNDGNLPLRYSVTADATGAALLPSLTWTMWVAPACTSPTAPIVTGLRLSPGTGRALVGDARPGVDPGDRLLVPQQQERLCVSATLDGTATNELQGATATADLVVYAEHDPDAG